ncbi:MAG: hypothetical protein ABR590_00825, partial [Spirochaetia bacterium]
MRNLYVALLPLSLFLLISVALGAAESAEIPVFHAPGTYVQDIQLCIENETEDRSDRACEQPAEYLYRFPDGPWRRTQGPILLSAAPGEIRRHLIEVAHSRHFSSSESSPEDSVLLEYTINRRRPTAPQPTTAPGLYTENIGVELSVAKNTRTTYSLDGTLAVYDGSPVSLS